ncbi:MAG: trigger factor [Deinococcales bacterium]|nr:trigger factor [Chitinophagaceae bacterium]
MAKVIRENVGLLTDKLTITVFKEDYLSAFDKNLKQHAKTANIPGFRKGMVPSGLIRKMYGASVFQDEVLKTVEKEMTSYLFVQKLNILFQPLPVESDVRVLDCNNPKEYAFSFEIGLKPTFNVDVKNTNVTKFKIDVTDDKINDEVARLQTRFGKMTEPETVTNDEDVLNVTFTEVDAEGNVPEGGINKANSVLVKYFTEDFKAKVLGLKVNDVLDVHLASAFGDTERTAILEDLGLDKNEAGSAVKTFKMTITKIGFVEKAAIDETFFAAAYPTKTILTEDKFRAAVKEDIAAYYNAQSRNQMSDEIYHNLLDNTTIQLPDSFLQHWLQVNSENPKSEEEVAADYPAFANQLKWSLISAKLTEDYNIKVQPDDIKEFAKMQLFQYMGGQMDMMGENNQWVDDYANRMMQDKKFVEDSYQRISTEKIFESLLSTVSTTEEAISEVDFTKKQHHHNH